MADICVIYASEDEPIVQKLILLLRNNWDVWWARDISNGNWEDKILSEISKASAVIPVFSHHIQNKDIFKDELRYSQKKERLIFPFFINEVEPPLGFGSLNRTDAFGWDGDENHKGFIVLKQKISSVLKETRFSNKKLKRLSTLKLRNKTLNLPCFVFSLSSHETQVHPKDGVKLLQLLEPVAGLISAYDVWKCNDSNPEFLNSIYKLKQSSCALFLDSGNYEAYRKKDLYSSENIYGWKSDYFRQVASEISPDIAFAFDETDPKGDIDEIAARVINNYRDDIKAIYPLDFPLCPIIHLPEKRKEEVAEYASNLATKITSVLDPIMVAIPERELGNGLVERFKTVCVIRNALNSLGKYYPIHLLGTGNPISMVAFAAAGADSFDGLEWCRTVADYDNGNLFHFQHFDCFNERYISRLRSQELRKIIEDENVSYTARVLSYNFDFFNSWIRTMQSMIYSDQVEYLLKNVPNIGDKLYEELMK